MRIGLQISSLKPYIQTCEGVRDTFRRVNAMGYTDVQLQWTGEDVPCEFIAEQLKENSLACWGTQDYYDVVVARMDTEVRAAALYGSKYICVSGVPERYMCDGDLDAMAREMRSVSARLADSGILLTFHPRHMELRPIDGGAAAAERLLDMVPDMQLTLDIYQSEMAGMDTAALMRRYAGRVDMLHFKDAQTMDTKAPLTPVGAGAIDFAPALSACADAGVKIGFAEQERWQGDAFECMKQSLDYMRGIIPQ